MVYLLLICLWNIGRYEDYLIKQAFIYVKDFKNANKNTWCTILRCRPEYRLCVRWNIGNVCRIIKFRWEESYKYRWQATFLLWEQNFCFRIDMNSEIIDIYHVTRNWKMFQYLHEQTCFYKMLHDAVFLTITHVNYIFR